MAEVTGAVLAGAGARGGFEACFLAGVLPELEQQGRRPRIFCGSSAGAINSTLLAAYAHLADVAHFALVHRPLARNAVQALADRLERLEGPDGTEFYDVPDGVRPDEETPAPPRLLPMWDSTLLAYADGGRMTPAEYRKLIARSNGDVLPTVLVDGYVAGVWRPVDGGIEVTAFHRLPADVWEALEGEAAELVAFLSDREPLVYRRYARWWDGLPDAQVRVLRPRP